MLNRHKNKGSALLVILFFTLVMGSISAILLKHALYERRANARFAIYKQELNVAEYGLNKMISEVIFLGTYKPAQVGGTLSNFHSAVLGIQPPRLTGFTFSQNSVTCLSGGDLQYATIDDTSHYWYGYPALRIVYRMQVRARSNDSPFNNPGVKLQRDVEVLNIPLYVFGIFYDNLLEIYPGAKFDMYGRVHSNSDIWLGADTNDGVNYHEHVTSAGNFYHGRNPLSGMPAGTNGQVYIYNGTAQKGIKQPDGTWLDSTTSGWATLAMNLWNGYVRDQSLGIRPIRVPIPPYQPQHAIIERASTSDEPALKAVKFEYQADLKIVRDPATDTVKGYDKNGNDVSLTYTNPQYPYNTKSIYKESSFYNFREAKTIRCLDLDIANLKESGISVGNGVIYMSEELASGKQPAVRVINGSTLPTTISGALSIATDDPLYVKGNFNTGSSRIPALLAGDSINILSNSFSDSKQVSTLTTLQVASATETNAIFLAGNVPSGKYTSTYSGGAENFFRYMENWSGVKHTFRGSMLNCWESVTAIGKWIYGTVSGKPYYNAPNRDWYWDSVLGGINPPPGMVSFFQVNPLTWNIIS